MATETTIDILAEILKVEPNYYKPEWVYEFSNSRKFLNTDDSDSGIYEKT